MKHAHPEQRRVPRSSIYLKATISRGQERWPATILDITAAGARVRFDGDTEVGETVCLERGELTVPSRVAWSAGHAAGLQFHSPINVDEWLIEGPQGQGRVDRLLRRARAGAALPPLRRVKVPDADTLRTRLVQEIGFAERLIEAIGEALAEDQHVVEHFGKQLQSLELGCKMLQTASALLASEQLESDVQEIGLHEMKARLLRT